MAKEFSPKEFVVTVIIAGAILGAITGSDGGDKTVFAVAIIGGVLLLVAGRVNRDKNE